MGNLLRVLTRSVESENVDVWLDFENATPTESEREVWEVVHSVLEVAPSVLKELEDYNGASAQIREYPDVLHIFGTETIHASVEKIHFRQRGELSMYINDFYQYIDNIFMIWKMYEGKMQEIDIPFVHDDFLPMWVIIAIANAKDDDLQEVAWMAVLPLVGKLKRFYEFSLELESVVPQLLYALCVGSETPEQHLERQQALAKQFAEILHYTLKFDDLKMLNPSIQNDFSYYRRTLSRKKMSSGEGAEGDNIQVSTEMANRMSLFYAYPTPFLKTLSDATTKFVSENKSLPIENTTNMLCTLAKLCKLMIENTDISARFRNEETKLFCLRVMVGVIILYDHVHPVGAFAKNAGVDIRGHIKVLKDQPPGTVDGLLNALRYTTKHLNDEQTPKQIKMLLS